MKRFIVNSNKSAFIVEHDFIMVTYMADRVVMFTGIPAVKTVATAPNPVTLKLIDQESINTILLRTKSKKKKDYISIMKISKIISLFKEGQL
jgi:translation initiation factor RLI1